jgi:hypothetical protein
MITSERERWEGDDAYEIDIGVTATAEERVIAGRLAAIGRPAASPTG